ncbi:MAG: peptidase [Sulfurovum sp.]
MKKMSRSKKDIITRMNKVGLSTRVCLGHSAVKKGEISQIDKKKRLIPFTLISKDNAGERSEWWQDEVYIEELDVNGANFEYLRTFFTDHRPSVDNAIGRIKNVRVKKGILKGAVIFGESSRSKDIFDKYVSGILTDVSIGYRVNDVKVTEREGEPTHILVTDFDILELSAVWQGFDSGANVGREVENSTPPKQETQSKKRGRNIENLQKQLNLKEKLS